jgi:hypothetical protein
MRTTSLVVGGLLLLGTGVAIGWLASRHANSTSGENAKRPKPEPGVVAKTFLDALQANDTDAIRGLMTKAFIERIENSHKGFTIRAALLHTGNGSPDSAFVTDSWTITEDGPDQVWSEQVTTWRIEGTATLNGGPRKFTMLLEKQKDSGVWRVETFLFR